MKIAVYCSAKDSIPAEYKQVGVELGKWIAAQHHTLVYGGATGGLMSQVSNSVSENGGEVIGVVPARIIHSGRKAENCTQLYQVQDMSERKRLMRQLADCFICLPGSYGTLDEMFDCIASATVGEHHKPMYILNYNGFYQPLIMQIKHMQQLQFIPQQQAYTPKVVNSLEELIDRLNTNH